MPEPDPQAYLHYPNPSHLINRFFSTPKPALSGPVAPFLHDWPKITNTNTKIKNTKILDFSFKITNINTNPNTNTNIDFTNIKILDFPFQNKKHKHKNPKTNTNTKVSDLWFSFSKIKNTNTNIEITSTNKETTMTEEMKKRKITEGGCVRVAKAWQSLWLANKMVRHELEDRRWLVWVSVGGQLRPKKRIWEES